MPVSKTNIRAANANAESLKLNNSYFVAHRCLYMLCLPEAETVDKTNSMHLFSHMVIKLYSANTVYLSITYE